MPLGALLPRLAVVGDGLTGTALAAHMLRAAPGRVRVEAARAGAHARAGVAPKRNRHRADPFASQQGAQHMAKPVHSMIRVRDEARSLDFYARAFGLERADRYAFDGFTLVYLRHPSSPFELELTVNDERTEPYSLGDGYGHLAVVVDDVDAEHARFEREGFEATAPKDLVHGERTLARFFFATDPDGYKIEVIQRGGRFS